MVRHLRWTLQLRTEHRAVTKIKLWEGHITSRSFSILPLLWHSRPLCSRSLRFMIISPTASRISTPLTRPNSTSYRTLCCRLRTQSGTSRGPKPVEIWAQKTFQLSYSTETSSFKTVFIKILSNWCSYRGRYLLILFAERFVNIEVIWFVLRWCCVDLICNLNILVVL